MACAFGVSACRQHGESLY
ncbi:hypothetical protein M3234_24680 [Neobacillus niacini]|nr:hypothetical protein [Neobacillus niacini]